MANIAEKMIDGVSYTYDTESKNPLALKNVKKMVDGTLLYTTDKSGVSAPVGVPDDQE